MVMHMAQYNLEKTGRSSRRVAIKKGGLKFHPGAIVVACLVAFFVWLFLEGQTLRNRAAETETGDKETAAVAIEADTAGEVLTA